eukprot:9497025-Pyramimonas_sp.AAC.1
MYPENKTGGVPGVLPIFEGMRALHDHGECGGGSLQAFLGDSDWLGSPPGRFEAGEGAEGRAGAGPAARARCDHGENSRKHGPPLRQSACWRLPGEADGSVLGSQSRLQGHGDAH